MRTSEAIRRLEVRIAQLEKQAQRLRPNLQLADQIIDPIMLRVKRAKKLSSLLFQKNMTLKDAHFARHYSGFPGFNMIEKGIKEKDYDRIANRADYIRRNLDDRSDWNDITITYPYMLSAIPLVGKLVRRDDVWGEEGFRKFKLGWNKFKKATEKCWRDYQEIMGQFEDLEDEEFAGGVSLKFAYTVGIVQNDVKASMSLSTGVLSINLSALVLTSDRALRSIIEHELVHYEQHLKGLQFPTQEVGYDDHWVEHSLKDMEFDPRLNDVGNAISDLIEEGLSAREAIDLLINGGRMPDGVDDFIFDSAQKWLLTLKRYDGEKYRKAIREIESDFL